MIHPLLVLADEQYLHTDALPRALKPATVAKPKNQPKPYKLADGGGLFLLVLPKGNDGQRSRLWRYKYRVDGKEGLYALGAYPEISLADARKMLRAARWLVERGKHPLQYVEEAKQYQAQEAARRAANTFRVVCESWLSRDKKSSARTIAQRRRELEKDVFPRMGDKAIADIRKEELKELLEAVQERAPEVARNIRNYLTGIFDYAMDAHLVTGSPVPGPKVLNTRDQVPHPALPVARAGEFLRALDAASCTEQLRIAMRLLVLTVVRKSELIEARWAEFDLEKGEWSIPAARMKARNDHWVPLSAQAVVHLKRLRAITADVLLFPNARDPRRPMASRSMNALLDRLGYLEGAKPHGFRAMFSTHFNNSHSNPDVIEACLAHKPQDRIRAKYNRAEYEESRRTMMQDWADHLDALASAGNVVTAEFNRAA